MNMCVHVYMLFYVYECFVQMYVCAPYECLVHTEVRREPLELELWSCESLCRYLGPLQEYMFLMAEPSVQLARTVS